MVGSRSRRWLCFVIFLLPALTVYVLFFINPFAQGIRISFTNWDGLTPRAPISMPKEDFESQILSQVRTEADQRLLLGVYRLDPTDGMYKRYELTGGRKNKVYRILDSVDYRPETYRYVGLRNFIDIFTGGVEERFYPHTFVKSYFNEDSSLPDSIVKEQFEGNFLANLSSKTERTLALEHYQSAEDEYVLKERYDEFLLEDRIWLLPEVDIDRSVSPAAVDELIGTIKTAGLQSDERKLGQAVDRFLAENTLSQDSAAGVRAAAKDIYNLGSLKKLLASKWRERTFELGVVGFTLFFTFFNVMFSNLLAFALALALDTGIRSRNALRTIFFLPNVLSMIVVALVWSFVFYNLLPSITGVELWMGDPAKAPWLLVMVQVWQQSGYLMVIYLAGLQNVPTDVHEAALIDGASFGKKLRFIVIPLLIPALTICLFLSLSNSLKSFDLVYAMVGPSGYALGTVPFVMDIFFDAFAKRLAGLATAKAMILFVAILLITGTQLTIMKRREVRL